MADFKEIFKKVFNREIHGEDVCIKKELPFSKYLTHELFSEWLEQEKVLEFIFVESPHAELIKRSLELCYVRCQNTKNQITP